MDLDIPSDELSLDWAKNEFATLKCKDVRIRKRFQRVASDFIQHPGASIPNSCKDWAGTKACYRLFDSDDIKVDAILSAHRDAVIQRFEVADENVMLVIQDTTSLNFRSLQCVEGFGPIGSVSGKGNRSDLKTPGLFIHGQLVVGGGGVVHGLAGASIYARKEKKNEPAGKRNRVAIGEKESKRWVEGWREAQRIWEELGGTRTVLSVADREADIYELFAACQQQRREHGGGAGLLIRSQHDRVLESGAGRMWENEQALPIRATLTVELPRGKRGIKERQANLAVRAGRVRLAVPAHKKKYLGLEDSLEFWALEIKEIDPPPGVEGICWRLVTTEPITGEEDARRLTGWYSLRWQIELLHRVLKSGCRVERRQVRDIDKLKAFIALDLVIAGQLLAMTRQARVTPEASSEQWLEEAEWEALAVHAAGGGEPPEKAPTIREAVGMIAKLGGFLGRKGDGEPGVEVLWRGMAKLQMLAQAWLVFRPQKCG